MAADWNVQLGQIKFEVLALDGRGLLPFDWITIPAAGGKPELTVSKNSPTHAEVLNALFWRYADSDAALALANGILSGNASSGVFSETALVNGSAIQAYATPFVFKQMNLDVDDLVLAEAARAPISTPGGWHAANQPYSGLSQAIAWGLNDKNQSTIPCELTGKPILFAAGESHCLALKSNGTVVGWGDNSSGQRTIPAGLSGVNAIAAGYRHSLALKAKAP